MLTLKNVNAGYGGGDIIKNISLEIAPGQNLSIIGANGCGKSTLLKVMAGLLPYKGEIILDGKPLKYMKRKEISAKIAMLSQITALYFSYSVYDTVMMGRYVHEKNGLLSATSRHDKEMVLHCLKTVNMLDEKDRDITKLSGGQLQRVFLARTLAQDPQIILLDEPTNHLDLKYQVELLDYLIVWAKENNRSIVGVLHDINHAMRLSEYVLAMRNGEIAKYGKGIITGELLKNVYDVDVVGYMRQTLASWNNVE
ncbi:MAG: ABC transporter ATP-binding protein [Firmicutes bacterium]|nr:ABC transporter ATP-binding protein [Bacillota bacterium]